MFIIESDEIDKLYLPAHSNHRHNATLYMYKVLSRCYPSGATRSHIYKGGGDYSRGEGSHSIQLF